MFSIHLLTSLAMAAVAAAAAAAFPPVQNSTSPGFIWNPSPSDQSTCDPSTFDQASIDEAADWRHCAALSSSWSSTNGTFRIDDVSGSDYIPILQPKGCVFGVKATDSGYGYYTMGDVDVKAILKAALQHYSEGTDLAVQGDVSCDVAAGGRASLHWQIYNQSP